MDVFTIALALVSPLTSGAEPDSSQDWMYPGLHRRGSSGTSKRDDTILARHFLYETDDPFPQVIAWYVRKADFKADSLLDKLDAGAAEFERLSVGTLSHVDSDAGADRSQLMTYQLEANRGHATIFKPDPDKNQTIVISIAGDASKTTVQFIQSLETKP